MFEYFNEEKMTGKTLILGIEEDRFTFILCTQ